MTNAYRRECPSPSVRVFVCVHTMRGLTPNVFLLEILWSEAYYRPRLPVAGGSETAMSGIRSTLTFTGPVPEAWLRGLRMGDYTQEYTIGSLEAMLRGEFPNDADLDFSRLDDALAVLERQEFYRLDRHVVREQTRVIPLQRKPS